jgi:hypothetical protein
MQTMRTIRLLAAVAATVAVSLVFLAAVASAKTVYDYVYSGTFFDGTGSTNGQFPTEAAGLAYDAHAERFYVGVGTNPSYISKFTKAGVADPFSVSGLSTTMSVENGSGPVVAVDQSNTATEGNFYISGSIANGSIYDDGFTPDGSPLPGFSTYREGICGIAVDPDGNIVLSWRGGLSRLRPDGSIVKVPVTKVEGNGDQFGIYNRPLQEDFISEGGGRGCSPTVDDNGDIYSILTYEGFIPDRVVKSDPYGQSYFELTKENPRGIAIDSSNGQVFVLEGNQWFSQYGSDGATLGGEWGKPEGGYPGLTDALGIAVDPTTHDVWVLNRSPYAGVLHVEKFERVNPINIPDTRTTAPEMDNPLGTTAVLKGIVNPGGSTPADKTAECRFEYGTAVEFNIGESFGSTIDCSEGTEFTGTEDVEVSAEIPATPTTRYFYRLSSKNGNGQISRSGPRRFIAEAKPIVKSSFVDAINTDSVRFNAKIDPNFGNTKYLFEYGPVGGFTSSTPESAPFGYVVDNYEPGTYSVSRSATGLSPGVEYQYRVVATNEAGSVPGPTQYFSTYLPDPGVDPCPNANARQQTEASLLPDCRAYELVSARNTGGFDVVTDLVPGKAPIPAFPRAGDRLIYSPDFGLLPGIEGSPTNLGLDPHIASRGPDGWTTKYVGLPADGMADDGAFGSPLLGADQSLETFAFGGPEICDPCFADNSINIPLRRPDGTLEKGMAGSLNPAADPAGEVRVPVSADGSHLVFGSEQKFDLAGNEGSVSIYDRNLQTGVTQVVSTLPNGQTMSGDVGQLDMSAEGSRIVVGERISTDGKGNDYWHLYMHVGGSADSVDLTPGATSGVVYNGMTDDGSRVFLTTTDKLLGTDTDLSSDIYEVTVNGGGSAQLRLVTTKGGLPSNDDSCNPPGTPDNWNAVSGAGRCNAVAFAGGAGVASGDGTLYFASPELLDGANGDQDQANLYVVEPGGNPDYVATIDSSAGTAPEPPNHPIVTSEFGGPMSNPAGITVDQATGDVYAAQFGNGKVTRFNPNGTPKEFSSLGTNSISGFTWVFEPTFAQVAVDNSPGPANGRIYVVSGSFGSTKVSVYDGTGALKGTITGTNTPSLSLGFACGVSVDQSNGNIYIGDFFGHVWRYTPSGATVAETDYSGGITTPFSSCNTAAAAGQVYTNVNESGQVRKYQASDFALGPPPSPTGTPLATTNAKGVAVDPTNGDVYVDRGTEVAVFDSTGAPLPKVGTGQLSGSLSPAVDGGNGHVFATRSGSFITEFGIEEIPYTPIDNPAIVHGIQDSEAHSFGDFQVTPDGRYAAFNSDQSLTGFPTLGFGEVYRYDSVASKVDCASCPKTGAVPTSSTSLPRFGAGLTDDGRVFYATLESFALRDTNGARDPYEWSDGSIGLISTGVGKHDSGMLGVGADGVNAFFFTREKLSTQDENSGTYRIYVAREDGGFLNDPPPPPCAAADECRGAGTPIPEPPNINTQTGSQQQTKVLRSPRCPKGKVRHKGKCVKKKARRKGRRGAAGRNG